MASDQHFAACEAADQCERNELCTRGFRHHGKGGHCSFKPKAGPTEPPAAVVASDTIGKRRVGQRGVKLLEVGTIADKESTALTGFDMSNAFWEGQIIHVPAIVFQDEDPQGYYTGQVTRVMGMHVQLFFPEDGEQYWFSKRRSIVWLRTFPQPARQPAVELPPPPPPPPPAPPSQPTKKPKTEGTSGKRGPASQSHRGSVHDVDEFEIEEFSTAEDQHWAVCEATDQCERKALCTRGFRHRGKGGHCSFKPGFKSAVIRGPSAAPPAAPPAPAPRSPFPLLPFDGVFNEADACHVCGSTENEHLMLLCDNCDRGYHTSCLRPPLTRIPEGEWYCLFCEDMDTDAE